MNDYFTRNGQSSGKLSSFLVGGPDSVLFQEAQEAAGTFWRFPFELGNAFEALCEDCAKDDISDIDFRTDRFSEKFFVSEIKSLSFGDSNGKRSTAEEIAWTIQAGKPLPEIKLKKWAVDLLKENFPEAKSHKEIMKRQGFGIVDVVENMCRNEKLKKLLKKEGAENQTHKKTNALIRECAANPGKLPMTQSDFKMLRDLAAKMCAMPLPKFWLNLWGMNTGTVGDFFRACEWQRPIYWDAGGIAKKALPDCMIEHDGFGPVIDIKYSATLPNFAKRLRSGYWIQDQHYQEGIRSLGLKSVPMLFVVGAPGDRSTPPTVTAFMADPGERCTGNERCFCEACRWTKYGQASEAYHDWEKSGRTARGFLEPVKEKVWV